MNHGKKNLIMQVKPDCSGHRERLRRRYEKCGIENWQDYEILELLLTCIISRLDTKPLAKRLIKRFKTFSGVLEASPDEMVLIEGVGKKTALFLHLLKDICAVYLKEDLVRHDVLSSPRAVYDYLKVSLKGSRNEEFKVIFLNSRNVPVAIEKIQEGTVDRSVVYPRKIVEQALRHRAVSVIFSHNHPGGALNPSDEDRVITRKLKEALSTVDITVLDHIIISSKGYLSFKEEKLI